MNLVLFDIDGTLILTGGAGKRAFSRAMEEVLGLADPLAQVRLDGKTDLLILEEALDKTGRGGTLTGAQREALYRRYVSLLEAELQADTRSYSVLPGVVELLEELARDNGVLVGLATGNLELGARTKLGPGNLNRYFEFGGFGSDSADRTELIRTAIRRGELRNQGRSFRKVFVLGDTPQDIRCGRAAGARVVAVATGNYSVEALAACSPDMVVEQLKPVEPVLRFIRDGGGR
jgi:phosphoglycolate phosphatase-like HAD superfamily hydrolase